MRCGLFGKLPAKRDFVSAGVPRAFLRVWEPWLERGLAECRRRLPPEDWAAAFASAPVWRFWLHERVCGTAVVGLLAPSTDACGRLFPLTLIGVAEPGEVLLPPFVDPHAQWLDRAEALVLASLEPGTTFETTIEALDLFAALPGPHVVGGKGADPPPAHVASAEAALRESFARLVETRRASGLASTTCWWSKEIGMGEPLVRIDTDMPSPATFSEMVTVRFAPRAEPAIGIL